MLGRNKIMELANSKYISGDKSTKLKNAWLVFKTWEIISISGNVLYIKDDVQCVYINPKYIIKAKEAGFVICDECHILINKYQEKLYVNFEKFTRRGIK